MSLCGPDYSVDPDVFNVDGVKAGSAEEMEVKLQALMDGDASPDTIADILLTGTEEGPEWEAALVFGSGDGVITTPRSGNLVFAFVGGNKDEAYQGLLAKLDAADAGGANIFAINKIEIAGGGDGSSFMALTITSPSQG